MKIAVIGVGHMGSMHAEKYYQLSGVELSAVVDKNKRRADKVAAKFNCDSYSSLDRMFSMCPDIEAVSVAVPTNLHAPIAEVLLKRRIACLIEKPVAMTVSEARRLADLASRSHTVVQVGHIERFNPAVRTVSRMGLVPLLIKTDRVSRMSFRSTDVDVVFDVMIHDIDLALLFTGSPIKGAKIKAHGVAVGGHSPHVANARVELPTGCLIDMTASRLALSSKRELRMFTRDSYISIDCANKRATLIRECEFVEGLRLARRLADKGKKLSDQEFREMVRAEELLTPEESSQDPLLMQTAAFIQCVKENREPEVGLDVGINALVLAEKISRVIRK